MMPVEQKDKSKQIEVIKQLFTKEKNLKIIVIMGIIGMVLILFSEFLSKPEGKIEKAGEKYENSYEYVAYIENKLHKIISSMKGVNNPEIMITLESGSEYVYAQEEKKNQDTSNTQNKTGEQKMQTKDTYEESVVIVDTNGNRNALVTTQLEPKIKGVVVVCKGGDDPIIRKKIIDTITTALQISAARVSITEKS